MTTASERQRGEQLQAAYDRAGERTRAARVALEAAPLDPGAFLAWRTAHDVERAAYDALAAYWRRRNVALDLQMMRMGVR